MLTSKSYLRKRVKGQMNKLQNYVVQAGNVSYLIQNFALSNIIKPADLVINEQESKKPVRSVCDELF